MVSTNGDIILKWIVKNWSLVSGPDWNEAGLAPVLGPSLLGNRHWGSVGKDDVFSSLSASSSQKNSPIFRQLNCCVSHIARLGEASLSCVQQSVTSGPFSGLSPTNYVRTVLMRQSYGSSHKGMHDQLITWEQNASFKKISAVWQHHLSSETNWAINDKT
jgi:hypothetical protein